MYEKKKTGIAVGSCIDSYQCGWNGFCRAFYTMTAILICVIRFTGKC